MRGILLIDRHRTSSLRNREHFDVVDFSKRYVMFEPAVWRSSENNFWVLQSGGGQSIFKLGVGTDVPIASVLVR